MSAQWRLIYTSRRTCEQPNVAAEELVAIQAAAAVNNARNGLSGALIASNRRFAQVLEGSREALERQFEIIACDSRHDDLLVICFAPIESPVFGEFSLVTTIFDETGLSDPNAASEAMVAQLRASMDRLDMTKP